jgi:hypothetical protein
MNRFEDHIKRKIKNHSSPLDTDALWNSISGDIPKEEDRKKRGVFFLFLFGLGIIGGMTFIYSNPASQNELANYFYNNLNTPLIAEDIYYENNMDFQHNDMMPPMFGHHISDNNDVERKLVASKHIKSVQPSFINTVIFSTLFLNKKKEEKIDHTTIFALQNSLIQSKIEEELSIALKEITAIKSHESLASVDLLDAEVLAMNDEEIENISIDKYEEEEIEKEKKKVKMAIGFTTGYSSSTSIFSTDLAKYNYYARSRSNREEQKGMMTISGDFVLSFHNNMRFRTGLEYTRIAELFSSYSSQDNVSDPSNRPEESTNNSSTDYNLNSNEGNDSNVNTPSSSGNARQLEFQSTNQHHFIDIPLIAGYEIGKRKLSLLVETGLSLSIRAASKGNILLLDGSYTNLKNTAPVFNRNINITSYTGLSLNYDLNNRTQLKLGGHFKYNPFSITRKDYPIKQKYRSTGIHIGILHQL